MEGGDWLKDRFDWKQALGPAGSLLGWASPFQKSLRAGASARLSKFMLAQTAEG